jgi:hypothetical protein
MDVFRVALASACAAFPVLGVLGWIRDRADRAAAAGLDAVDIDPYHAVATARDPYHVDEAAAAELLLAGLIRIRDDGMTGGHRQGRGVCRGTRASGASRPAGHTATAGSPVSAEPAVLGVRLQAAA